MARGRGFGLEEAIRVLGYLSIPACGPKSLIAGLRVNRLTKGQRPLDQTIGNWRFWSSVLAQGLEELIRPSGTS